MKSSLSRHVNVTVVTTPAVIHKGQLLEVSVALTSPEGLSVVTPRVYMEIVDSKGLVVWPMSVIAANSSGFTRLISTSELKTNTRYNVRVAVNNKLIYQGTSFFKTSKSLLPFLAIPAALAPLLQPSLIVPETAQKAEMLVYTTEHDTRVCPICLNYAGRTYRPDDPELPRIGPPEYGGATHWNCRCNYLVIGVLNAALLKANKMRQSALIVLSIQNHKKQKRIRKP